MATWKRHFDNGFVSEASNVPPARVPLDGMVSFMDQVHSKVVLAERSEYHHGDAWAKIEKSSVAHNLYTVMVWGKKMSDIHYTIRAIYQKLGVYGSLSPRLELPDLPNWLSRLNFLKNWIIRGKK